MFAYTSADRNWIRIHIEETELKHTSTRMDNSCLDRSLCSVTETTAGRGWINYLLSAYISIFF